jgi:hypothetical protein
VYSDGVVIGSLFTGAGIIAGGSHFGLLPATGVALPLLVAAGILLLVGGLLVARWARISAFRRSELPTFGAESEE